MLNLAPSSFSLKTPTYFKTSAFLTASKASIEFFKLGRPLLAAYNYHSLVYPFPSNLTAFVSLINLWVISSTLPPFLSYAITYLISFVIIEAMTVILKEAFCLAPTDLNSNLLPVKAKGLVLFLSVLSCKKLINPGTAFLKSLIWLTKSVPF